MVESAGPFNWVDVKWKDTAIKGISDIDEALTLGDRCYFNFPRDKVLLFDRETERKI
jgi:hypothetical protein